MAGRFVWLAKRHRRIVIPWPATRLDHALTLALQAEIDVGLLDINVDGSVVFPIADVLRFREIPFVFVTGYDFEALPERFRGGPMLSKPFSQRQFADILNSVLLKGSGMVERA